MIEQTTAPRVSQPIAVIGLACRFPDADDPAALLDVVLAGRRPFRRLPAARVSLADYYQSDEAIADATYSTRAALIEGWQFECAAFGIDESVYSAADPAHWLALETAARALAAAGLPAGTGLDRDRTGVIVGNSLAGDTSRANALRLRWPFVRRVLTDALASAAVSDDQADGVLLSAESGYLTPFPALGPYSLAGSLPATIAAGISTYFGFRGGSHAVDSACSSSLQAVASACAALAAGELDAAIAGGVDLSLDPLQLIGLAKAGLLARTDVRIYDQDPTGYLPGEGCGMLVLMRTADARAAGLPVYAEILGWGASSGSVPGDLQSLAGSQLLAMRRAYDHSGVDPGDVHYVEGNGAGTAMDDVAELTALAAIRSGARRVAALGSVKANIGHAQAAAGAAGLIKTVLALGTGIVPPATGAGQPHELVASGDARLSLPPRPREWDAGTRLAAVSTSGIGGSNVHVVLRHEPASRARQERWIRSVPLLARAAAAPGQDVPPPRLAQAGQPLPFLVHAPDRFALAGILARIAAIAPGLSDAEVIDLACLLSRDTARQGSARVAIVAARQQQLAALANEALAMLPLLAEGLLVVRPGVFASAEADGRMTLLLSGASPAAMANAATADAPLRQTVTDCLDILRWLESLDVHPAAAVGHGLGALAGLAWAGVLGESEVLEIAGLRDKFLSKRAVRRDDVSESGAVRLLTGDGAAAGQPAAATLETAASSAESTALRTAIAQRFRLGPPRRRLISTITGAEVESVDGAIELICSGFAGAERLTDAVTQGAVGATLLVETGPGRTLTGIAADVTKVHGVSLDAGLTDQGAVARVAAALFAAGAIGDAQPLFAGQASRPFDIWREPVFLTSPCYQPQPVTPLPDLPEPAVIAGPAEAAAAAAGATQTDAVAAQAAADDNAAETQTDAVAAQAAADDNAAETEAIADATDATAIADATDAAAGADATDATAIAAAAVPAPAAGPLAGPSAVPPAPASPEPMAGLGAWVRCFTEELRPAGLSLAPAPSKPWRMFAAARSAALSDLSGQFTADPTANRTLAIIEDPADQRSRATALEAARDAISTGELLVITSSRGFSSFFASLHAEHPSIGVTLVRVPAGTASPAAVHPAATVSPGEFRELVLEADGSFFEPVPAEVTPLGGGDFPLGPDDVIMITRGSRGAALALARVLAICGTGIAVVGRTGEHDDASLIAGLEELRSAGARVGYEVIDVGDATSLTAAVGRIESRLGPVTAIAHGVRSYEAIPADDLTRTISAGQPGEDAALLEKLAAAVKPGQLRLILSFGTVVSRYGLPGAALHALSAAALETRAAQLAAASIGCQSRHIDLPAWTTGEYGDRPDLAAELAAADIAPLEVGAASRLLLKILTTPGLPPSVALHGRAGGAALMHPPTVTGAALAAAGLTGGGRFLRETVLHYPGIELICSAGLSLATDPYLADYRVDGMLVLPPELALEALAQAASVLAGQPLRRATSVRLPSPVLIPSAGQAQLRVVAQRDGDTITAALRCADSSYRTDHATAQFSCVPQARETPGSPGAAASAALPQLAGSASGLVDGTELYGPICFQSGAFRRIALLPEVTARSGRALARGADELAWFVPGSEFADTTFLLGSPGLNDAVLQVVQACVPHRRMRPAACESVQFAGQLTDGPVEIRAVARPMPAGGDGAANALIPAQAAAPAAELRGPVSEAASAALPAAAARPGAEMTPEELADFEVADRRPQSRKSRKARRQAATHPAAPATQANAQGARDAQASTPAPEPAPAPVDGTELAPVAAAPASASVSAQRWDVEAVDRSGQLLAAWRGLVLHDSGPLPRNAAWPPALLSVYLERNAVDLGLDDGIRIAVSCGQPDDGALPAAAAPQPAGATPAPGPGRVPMQSPPAEFEATGEGRHAGPERRALHTARVAGTGSLSGFQLTARAPVPVECGWAAVDPARRRLARLTGWPRPTTCSGPRWASRPPPWRRAWRPSASACPVSRVTASRLSWSVRPAMAGSC